MLATIQSPVNLSYFLKNNMSSSAPELANAGFVCIDMRKYVMWLSSHTCYLQSNLLRYDRMWAMSMFQSGPGVSPLTFEETRWFKKTIVRRLQL